MTDQTPIERAVQTLQEVVLTGRRVLTHDQAEDATHAVLDSIDTDELAEAIHGDQCPEDPDPGDYCTCDGAHYDRLALVVKNWLTGKDSQ